MDEANISGAYQAKLDKKKAKKVRSPKLKFGLQVDKKTVLFFDTRKKRRERYNELKQTNPNIKLL